MSINHLPPVLSLRKTAKGKSSPGHRDKFPQNAMALRHTKRKGKRKKREEEKVRKPGFNFNFKNTILALVCECCHFGGLNGVDCK